MSSAFYLCVALLIALVNFSSGISVDAAARQSLFETPAVPPGVIYPNGTVFYNHKVLNDVNSVEYRFAINATKCHNVWCENGGSCAEGTCNCTAGFNGLRCENDICIGVFCPMRNKCVEGKCVPDVCSGVACQNGATCNKISGNCDCVNGFEGMFCQISPCANINCLNGGNCVLPGKCECLNGAFGDRCEKDACTEGQVVCQNGGRCVYGKCYCNAEWAGNNCETPSDAAKQYFVLNKAIEENMAKLKAVESKFDSFANVTDPRLITKQFGEQMKQYQDKVPELQAKSELYWKTPRVIGLKPVRPADLEMPRTAYENAKIHEDETLAYKIAHEVRYRPLIEARDLVNRTLQQQQVDRYIINLPVPTAESPIGTFAEIKDKYTPVDSTLLDQDLAVYHAENEALTRSILESEDLLL